jgi:dipeptidyl aminopeptidase/acylaminoacyl peptidase
LLLLVCGGAAAGAAGDPEADSLPPGAVLRLRASGPVVALAFAPDGHTLAAAAHGDRDVRLWDARAGRLLRTLTHAAAVADLAWSADGGALACACGDGAVYVWGATDGRERRRLRGHAGAVTAVAFAPDGKRLASGGADGAVRLWDAAGGAERRCAKGPAAVDSLAFALDGKSLAVTDAEGKGVRLLDAETGAEQRGLKWPEKQLQLRAAFGPGGLLASCGAGEGAFRREVVLWDVALGEVRQSLNVLGFDPIPSRPCQARFSPDGRTVAAAGPDRAARLWEVATGQEVLRLRGHDRDVCALAFSPDGRRLATGGEDATVLVWDLERCAVPAPVAKAGTAEAARWWADLGGEDAATAYRAGWLLASAPAPAVALARRHLRPVPPLAPGRLTRLLADLDHEKYAAREAAEADLKALGRRAEADLRRTLKATRSAEVKRRAGRLLAPLDAHPGALPDERLASRALGVLERVGTDEARRLVKELADGCPTARQTQEARAALARLARRKQVAGAAGPP